MSGFIHFGVDTFTNREWGTGSEDPSVFNPTALNTTQWVEAFKKAGATHVIPLAKHHDGFCYWKTNWTRHQVNESFAFQERSKELGQSGDILEEVSKACTAANMDMGFYLSPWDMNYPGYGDEDKYNEYYLGQLREILGNPKYGNNGKIVEVWMDAAKGWGPWMKYHYYKYFELIHELQPECVVWSAYPSEVRSPGNEAGRTSETTWSLISKKHTIEWYDKRLLPDYRYQYAGDEKGDVWNLAECDLTITPGWYWHPNQHPKTSEQLANVFYTSIGRGGQFLLNLPPDRTGTIPTEIVDRAAIFGTERQKSFEDDLTQHGGVTAKVSEARGGSWEYDGSAVLTPDVERYWSMDDGHTTGWIEIDLGREEMFDVVSISEHIALGQRVKRFSCEVYTNGVWKMFQEATTIGSKRLLRQKVVSASKVRINITQSLAVPCIEKVGIFKAYGHFSLEGRPPKDLAIISYGELEKRGHWEDKHEEQCYLGVGESGSLKLRHKAAKFYVVGSKDPSYGIMSVFVDGVHIADVDTKSSTHEVEQVLYVSEPGTLSNKEIELKFSGSKPIAIRSIYVRDSGEGMFELDSQSYSVERGQDVKVRVRRVCGSSGKAKVFLTAVPDTAVPGVDYEHFSTKLVFDDGVVEKEAVIRVHDSGSGSRFSVELVASVGGAIVGDNWRGFVSIGNDLLALRFKGKPFIVGALVLCGVAGLLIVALVVTRKKRGGGLVNDEPLVSCSNDE
jgi:alpha-L-fucosidase